MIAASRLQHHGQPDRNGHKIYSTLPVAVSKESVTNELIDTGKRITWLNRVLTSIFRRSFSMLPVLSTFLKIYNKTIC